MTAQLPVSQTTAVSPRGYRPALMLFIAFLAQNIATGLTFGSIGLLIDPLARALHSSHSVIALAISMILLISSLLSPQVGLRVDRWSLRGTMLIGAALSAAGFWLTAQAASAAVYLCSFGVLVGAGFAMTGVLPATKIAALWFPRHFGRASGIVNLPVVVALGPPLFAVVLERYDWRVLLQGFAGVYVLLLLLIALVREPAADSAAAARHAGAAPPAAAPFRTAVFWVVGVAMGLITSSGIVASTHIVPYALSQGIAVGRAALLMSVMGASSIAGAMFYGWLADRRSPFAALVLNAALCIACWLLLMAQQPWLAIAALVAGLGFSGGGLMPALSALLARVFGARHFGAALGQMSLATLPFTFAAAPLAGLIYDATGHYRGAFLLEAGLCALALLLMVGGGVAKAR
jgi:MFS family permease